MERGQQDLGKVLGSLPKPQVLRDANEAKTRLVYIDRILGACGWTPEMIGVEEPTGTGDFIDYLLADGQQQPWMVIEAKRTARTFAIAKRAQAYRSLASLHKQSSDLAEVLDQAARYCNAIGAPYACVTNGYQWVFFRGLSAPGKPWLKNNALVFDSFDDISLRTGDFFRCLHRSFAFTTALPVLLERATGSGFLPERRASDSLPQLQKPAQQVSAATRAATEYLFSDIYGKEHVGMLDECYVVPGHSSEFEEALQRLLKDTPDEIASLNDDTRDGTPKRFIDDLAAEAKYMNVKHPIAVVGNVGAGKTTFLRRVLVDLIRSKSVICAYVDLEGRSTGGALTQEIEAKHLAREIVRELAERTEVLVKGRKDISDKEIPQAHPDSPETLRTIFRDRLERERRLGEKLYAADPNAWEAKKLAVYQEERADEVRYLQAYIRHLKARFRPDGISEGSTNRMPVVIFLDNLDQGTDDYQRFVYGFCAELMRETGAIAVLCLREDTYRGGRRAGGFLTSSQLQYVFHVASPPLDRVLRLRLEYGQRRLTEGRLPTPLQAEHIDVSNTLGIVETVFGVPTSEATSIVASLSGQDVRESLRLVRAVVQASVECNVTPRPSGECIFECMAARFGAWVGGRPGVFNLFDVPPWRLPLHALPARLVAYFVRAYDHVSKLVLERTERVVSDFSAWGYPPALVREALLILLRGGMLRSPELTQVEAERSETLPSRLVVTASGHAHLTRVQQLSFYRALSALHMRWYDEEALKAFVKQCASAAGERGVMIGDVVASGAVSSFDAYLAASLAKEDAQLASVFERYEWVRSVKARAYMFEHDQTQPLAIDNGARKVSIVAPTRASEDQLNLFVEERPRTTTIPMPSLAPDQEYMDSVWIPRILWALMHAERSGCAGLTAADVDRTLTQHAGLNVHATNVARAFRELELKSPLWECRSKRYWLTEAGRHAFAAAFVEDPSIGPLK